jgi:hypothetical protein
VVVTRPTLTGQMLAQHLIQAASTIAVPCELFIFPILLLASQKWRLVWAERWTILYYQQLTPKILTSKQHGERRIECRLLLGGTEDYQPHQQERDMSEGHNFQTYLAEPYKTELIAKV